MSVNRRSFLGTVIGVIGATLTSPAKSIIAEEPVIVDDIVTNTNNQPKIILHTDQGDLIVPVFYTSPGTWEISYHILQSITVYGATLIGSNGKVVKKHIADCLIIGLNNDILKYTFNGFFNI